MSSKNLIHFFRDFDIPQIVILHLGSEKSEKDQSNQERFICNSIILALHSDKFEEVISAGKQDVFLGFDDDTVQVETVRACIEFMYGDRAAIRQCDDIFGMCVFADTWDVPSLWVACLAEIEYRLCIKPVLLLDYLKQAETKFAELKPMLCLEINATFDVVARLYADVLIAHILQNSDQFQFNEKLFVALIENSKTFVCGDFILFLLAQGEETRKFIMRNLPILPVHTAFPDESAKKRFRDKLLCQAGYNNGNDDTSTHSKSKSRIASTDKQSVSSRSQSRDPVRSRDDNASIMELALKSGESSQSPGSSVFGKCSGGDTINGDTSSGPTAVKVDERTRLLIKCQYPVKAYPMRVENLSVYSRLEAIAHLVSKRNLSEKSLSFLLPRYFKNPFVASNILEDLKSIALIRCSSKKESVKKSLNKTLDIDMEDRVETFSISKYCYNMTEFLDKLAVENRISLNLDHGVLCQICHGASTPVDKGKKSAKVMKCILQGLDIDLSEGKINFIWDEEFHKDHLIHCYIVGLSTDKTPVSYVSIMQLTVAELIEELRGKVSGVKTVVVFSKDSPADSGLIPGILV